MEKKKRSLRANKLDNISPRYVDDHELQDPPARMFRALLKKMKMEPYKWGEYLRAYLEWSVPGTDPERVRVERTTRAGNIKDTYFHKRNLTINKFLEGLSILQMDVCEITVRVVDKDGNEHIVTDIQKITGATRPKPEISDDSEEQPPTA